MKFVYGKQDWKTLERGEENCYLMTNGLGGFSSLSMIASCSRNDQAVLMACLHSPNHRYNMIHRFTEVLCVAQKEYFLSSQETADHIGAEDGYRYQTGFSYEDYPQWTYLAEGVEVIRTIVLMQGSNTVGISYRLRNRSGKDISLKVMPHLQFMPKGGRLSREQVFTVTDGKISANGMNLHYRTNGVCAICRNALLRGRREGRKDGARTLTRQSRDYIPGACGGDGYAGNRIQYGCEPSPVC